MNIGTWVVVNDQYCRGERVGAEGIVMGEEWGYILVASPALRSEAIRSDGFMLMLPSELDLL